MSLECEFLHGNYKLLSFGVSETRPSKACQRVTSVFDSTIFAGSSEREQRILAASGSAKRALLHREREGGLNCESVYADLDIVGVGQCRTGQFAT